MKYFDKLYCATVKDTQPIRKPDFNVKVGIPDIVDDNIVYYIAASPPDYRFTYTGSALPFHSYQQAFQNTPNKGQIEVKNGEISVDIQYPNTFYIGLGTVPIPPTLFLYYKSKGKQIERQIRLSDGVPYRMLSYPMRFTRPRKNAEFYEKMWSLPVRTQEQIFRDATYPTENQMASDFWGLRPPV